MTKLLEFTFYNPDQLDDEAFLANFVARQDLVDKILARLRKIKRRGLAQHRLIVGQRGMGKTSLLRRIGMGVRDEPALAEVLLPLSFREEQYNVHNLHIFWCNCLDALGDWFEATGKRDLADLLDREVAALNTKEDDDEGSQALALFNNWMTREGRRPLLLLDNLDIIFAGLKKKQWSLRRVLQEAGGIVVIGASAAPLEATANHEEAFYDFFQVDVLGKLEHHEILLCLRRIAKQRGEAGDKVLQILSRDPARIHVLYDLTGGNPRTLAMLYMVLETSGDEGVMRDLERLLDQATPLYKARVEELSQQARVVFDALALAWDPATAADLASVTGLEVGVVSAQLDRLCKAGVIEKVSLSSTRRIAFQVAERFFNIWYLMRHSSRRQRMRLRWLTEMLRRIYTPRELRERAAGLLGQAKTERLRSTEYCLALSDALEDRELRVALRNSVCQRSASTVESDSPFEDDLSLPSIGRGPMSNAAAVESTIETYRKAVERTPNDAGLWIDLGQLLNRLPASSHEAETAFRKAIEIDPKDVRPWVNLGILLEEQPERRAEAEDAYRKAIEINPRDVRPWFNLGFLLAGQPERRAEAEDAYRKAIEIDPKNSWSWVNLGILLAGQPEQLAEAEDAYRKAIEIDPKDAWPWFSLGFLLAGQPERRTEAEDAYRKAIEIAPKDVRPWFNLGLLLAQQPERWVDAEDAYRKAAEIERKFAAPWNNLGVLMAQQPGRWADAEDAFRKALEIDPKGAGPWSNLGRLLAQQSERWADAEDAYRKAIEINPGNVISWNGLGNLLADHLSRPVEAEEAYGRALSIAPENPVSATNLAYLLLRQHGRTAEAEAVFSAAISLLPPHGVKLLRAFNALAHDNFGMATAELGSVLEEGHTELFTVFRDDLLRVLQLAADRGMGDKLLDWLKSSDFGDRYWPLQVAFDAYLHGEDRLMDVNPEVRSGARRLLSEMPRRPAAAPQPEPKKKPRQRKRD